MSVAGPAEARPGARVRRLTNAEIAAYDHIDPRLALRVRLVDLPYIPGGYTGITLGRWVGLAEIQSDDGTSTLIAHELVHVRQWQEQGVLGFSTRYIGAFLRGLVRHRRWRTAYLEIPAETEARAEALSWKRRTGLARPS